MAVVVNQKPGNRVCCHLTDQRFYHFITQKERLHTLDEAAWLLLLLLVVLVVLYWLLVVLVDDTDMSLHFEKQ